MASITIRRLDDDIKARLERRAARHNRSIEEEAREILRAALSVESSRQLNLGQAIRRHFESVGEVDLADPVRDPVRVPPDLS